MDRTVYGLTTRRAIVVVGEDRVEDCPLVGQPVTVARSRDGRHATVLVGSGSPSSFGLGPSFANTGWPMSSSVVFGFFDVPDPDPMLRALEAARRPAPR